MTKMIKISINNVKSSSNGSSPQPTKKQNNAQNGKGKKNQQQQQNQQQNQQQQNQPQQNNIQHDDQDDGIPVQSSFQSPSKPKSSKTPTSSSFTTSQPKRHIPNNTLRSPISTPQSSSSPSAKYHLVLDHYETRGSEVWIIISDLFQQLGLDECCKVHLDTKNTDNDGINPHSAHFHTQFPMQSTFIKYLEQTSGLVLVDIVETHSHNANRGSNTKSSQAKMDKLAQLKSNERVMMYVLRDMNKW